MSELTCRMADQADQPCQTCGEWVRTEDAWTSAQRYVFHENCFRCVKCGENQAKADWVLRTGRLFCRRCDLFSPQPPLLVPGRSVRPKCMSCCNAIDDQATTMRTGHHFCLFCLKCNNCQVPIKGHDCFELMDKVFCPRCHNQYREGRYRLIRSGAGPLDNLAPYLLQ